MNYSELITIALSFLSILICLFTIWFAILFYRLYTEFSLMITEMSKGLEISTIRLERIPKILYGKELILSKPTHPQNLIIAGKEKEVKSSVEEDIVQKPEMRADYNVKQDKDLLKQISKESEEI